MLRQALDFLSRSLRSNKESYSARQQKRRIRLDIETLELRWVPTTVSMQASTYSVNETTRFIEVQVDKGFGFGTGTVDYATSNGTATAGSDYTSTSGTLTFGVGDPFLIVRIPVTDDDISDNGETFSFTLSNPTGGLTLGSPTSATVTINDATSSWSIAGQQRVIDPMQGARYPFGDASIGLQTGDYSVSNNFDYGQGGAVFSQPSLVYHSDTTTARPIVEATITMPSGDVPSSSEARFTWNGGSPGSWTSFTNPASGDTRWVYGFQVTSAVSTGLYPWSIDVREHFSNLGDVTRTYSGTALVVANSGAFGKGWSVDGFNQLVAVSGGMMMVYGGGDSARLFTGSGGTYTSPANDYGTLVKNGNNTYTYTAKNQTQWNYDTSGNLTTMVDPHGLTRTFSYSSSLLSTVTEPDGGVTTFTYSSGKLATIVEPGSRTITITINGSSDLTSIADTDGSLRTFTYDSNHDLTNEQWGSINTTMTYDGTTGLLTNVDRGNSNTMAVIASTGLTLNTSPISRWGDVNTTMTDSSLSQLAATLDQAGRIITYNGSLPSGGGGTIAVPNGGGITSSITRDSAGNITVFTDALGRTTSYTYNGSGDLTQVKHPDNSLETITYDSTFHEVLTHTDTLSHTTTYTYNGTDDRTSVKDALGNLTTFTWSNGLLQSVQDANNHFTTFTYDGDRRLQTTKDALSNVTTYTYDSAGNVQTVKDALNRVTTFSYDAKDRVLSVVDALSGRTTFTYNAQGQVTSVADPLNHVTSMVYNAQGWNTSLTNAVGSGLDRTTTYTYLANGWVSTVKDALNHLTTYTYTIYGDVASVTDPLGLCVTYTYDNGEQLTNVTDALNNTTTFVYNNRGWITSEKNALNNYTTFTYDTEGNLLTNKNANNGISTYSYDALNRITAVTDPLSHTATGIYDSVGNVQITIDVLGNRTTYSYDADNRTQTIKDALDNVITYSYDAVSNVTSITDPLNNVTTYVYDSLNRRVNTIEPNGSKTTFIYDANSQMTGLIDPDSNRTTFVFDALGRQTQEIDALNKIITYTYDAADELTQKKNRLSQTIDYSYDAAGRLTSDIWKDSGGTTTNTQTFAYDNASRLLTAQDSQGTYTFTYDAIGEVLTQKDMWNTTLTYTYDNVGNTINVKDNFSGLQTSTYDAANRLTSLKFSGIGSTQIREDLTYTARNQVDTINRYSDLTASTKIGSTSFSYDAVGQETNLQYRNSAGTILSNYTYTYDADGRVTLENLGGTLTTYAYNSRSLITSDSVNTYTWDNAGNRTSNGATIGTGNRLASDNSYTYTYNDEGDLIQKVSVGGPTTTWTYNYDVSNRLTSISESAGGNDLYRTTYTYDVFNRRISENEDADGSGVGAAVVTRFSYDRDHIWADLDNTNALKVRYVRGDSGELFSRVKSNGDAAWFYTDLWGSTRQLVDNTGSLIDTITYDAFGNILNESNIGSGDRWKFIGRESISRISLLYGQGIFADQSSGETLSSSVTFNFGNDKKNHKDKAPSATKIAGPGDYPVKGQGKTIVFITDYTSIDDNFWWKWYYGDKVIIHSANTWEDIVRILKEYDRAWDDIIISGHGIDGGGVASHEGHIRPGGLTQENADIISNYLNGNLVLASCEQGVENSIGDIADKIQRTVIANTGDVKYSSYGVGDWVRFDPDSGELCGNY